jgi:predicted dehydrogenase
MREAEQLGLAELVAICDPSEETRRTAGERFGVAERYADYRELLGRADLDVVTIATPNSSHEVIAIAALEAGKHVLCEKPLALTYDGARRMEEAARRAGRKTSVNFRYRWVPSARYLKELVETGEVGQVHELFMTYLNAGVHDPNQPIRWRQTRAEGGGNLRDIGSHLIDLAHWLVGPVRRVYAQRRTFTPERPTDGGPERVPVDVDDAATCLLEFASGASGLMNVSGMALGRVNHQRIELYGSKAGAVYEIDRTGDIGGDTLQVCFGPAQHRAVGMAPARVLPRHHGTPVSCFLDFLSAIHEGREPSVTFADAVRVQEVLEAAESSAERGEWVELPVRR